MDYRVVAEQMAEVGELCVERAGVEPGMEVLDVACGTGNAAIPAARAGARVTGLDASADLLAIARERTADAMVEIEWVEGDPHALPFGDDSFDRVLCVFGPLDDRLVTELRRVSRGPVAVASWSPDSEFGRVLGITIELAGERRELEFRDFTPDADLRFRCEYVIAVV